MSILQAPQVWAQPGFAAAHRALSLVPVFYKSSSVLGWKGCECFSVTGGLVLRRKGKVSPYGVQHLPCPLHLPVGTWAWGYGGFFPQFGLGFVLRCCFGKSA